VGDVRTYRVHYIVTAPACHPSSLCCSSWCNTRPASFEKARLGQRTVARSCGMEGVCINPRESGCILWKNGRMEGKKRKAVEGGQVRLRRTSETSRLSCSPAPRPLGLNLIDRPYIRLLYDYAHQKTLSLAHISHSYPQTHTPRHTGSSPPCDGPTC
jgi:hypothetical protein